MKKIVIYSIIGIIILSILYYSLGVDGFLGGVLGLLGFGANEKIKQLKKEVKELDTKAEAVKENLVDIEKEKKDLEDNGVKDMTPEEEAEYWKKQ